MTARAYCRGHCVLSNIKFGVGGSISVQEPFSFSLVPCLPFCLHQRSGLSPHDIIAAALGTRGEKTDEAMSLCRASSVSPEC